MSLCSQPSRLTVLAGLSLALCAAAPALPANAEPSTVTATLSESATLIAKGAAVEITVSYTCSVDTQWADLGVFVTQRVPGRRIAQGAGSPSTVVCDGTEQKAVITVLTTNGNAFHSGPALVQGRLDGCDQDGACAHVPFSGVVDVSK